MPLPVLIFVLLSIFSSSIYANQKIVLWNAHEHASYLDKAISEFQQQTGIEVELHQFISARLREELLALSKKDQLPDLIYVPADFVGLYRNIHLSTIPDDWIAPALDSRVTKSGQVNNVSYGIPLFQGNHLMLFYNKSLVNKPARTWLQLKEQAPHLPSAVEYPISWKFDEMFWFVPFLSAFNGWPMDGDKITLDTPQMVNALNFYRDLYQNNLVSLNCDQKCAVARFKSGKSAYIINGDWAIQGLEDALGDQLGITTLPKIGTKTMQPMFSSYVLAFPKLNPESAQYQALKQFSLFMQSKPTQEMIYNVGGLVPANSQVVNKPQHKLSENQIAVLTQMTQTRPMPTNPNMVTAWLAMSKGLNRFIWHKYSAAKAAQYMQQIADKELARKAKSKSNSNKITNLGNE